MRGMGRLAALILAAGYSSRAPGFKPLLPLGGSTVIETAIGGLRRAGVGDIAVVVGHRAADLLAVLENQPVRTVVNEHYQHGMFTSIVAGVNTLPASADAFFLLPADIPLVKSRTIRLLARAGGKTGADIVYPVFAGRRGHPPLISARLAPAILAGDGAGGLRPLLAKYEAGARDVAVLDEGILLDIDTADDYQAVRRLAGRRCPTGGECGEILSRLAVPDAVVRHGRAVAGVARELAVRLNRAGLCLDEELVAAAALLHDLAKGRPDHPRRGARLIERLGYPHVAAIIAAHHDIAFAAGQPPDEAAVVHLADKLVKNDRIVPLEDRFACLREKFAADAAARAAAENRLAVAKRIAVQVEQALGAKLGEVVGGQSSPPAEDLLGVTESLCPECLKRIPAENIAAGEAVYQEKTCPEHGRFRTVIWRGPPAYQSWAAAGQPESPPVCATAAAKGCPFDCGLCPDHRRPTCCVLLEVTQRCNLGCPVCFAGAGGEAGDPDIATVESWYRRLLASGGHCNIQLSGGEPTLRDDLPELIALGRSLGFSYFQLNTNGLRLATDPRYGLRLKRTGLSCVFLQFDGLDDTVYAKIRGKPLLDIKKAAIARCAELGLGVVLVPTLVPGINTAQIGRLVEFAVGLMPAVRGVHFQPVSYFGRYPQPPADADRFTLPELMRALEAQTGGKMKTGDFRPSGARNAYCAFHANYLAAADGELKLLNGGEGKGCCRPVPAADGVRKARSFVARRWSAAGGSRTDSPPCCPGVATDSLDAFLDTVDKRTLCVSAMAFQDCGTIDLARLKDCPLHVLHPDGRLIPFCAYNLTDRQGRPLHRPLGDAP